MSDLMTEVIALAVEESGVEVADPADARIAAIMYINAMDNWDLLKFLERLGARGRTCSL